jgi:hypothetical protein
MIDQKAAFFYVRPVVLLGKERGPQNRRDSEVRGALPARANGVHRQLAAELVI